MVSIFTYNIAVANIDRGHCDVIKRLHGGLDCCHSCWLNIFLCFNFHNKSCCTKDDAQKYDPKNFPDFAHFVIEICEPVQCCLIAKFWETFQVIFSRHFEKMTAPFPQMPNSSGTAKKGLEKKSWNFILKSILKCTFEKNWPNTEF